MKKAEYEAVLEGTGLTLMECACLGKSLSEQRRALKLSPRLQLVRDANLYGEGLRNWQETRKSCSFQDAVRLHMERKKRRRARTQSECRGMLLRLIREVPELAKTKMRSITAEMCRGMIEQVFDTAAMRVKARRILHSLFETAILNGWCNDNPVTNVQFDPAVEATVSILTLRQVERLLRTLALPEHACCAAAVGLMMWAGIRPEEVARLTWAELDLQERVAYLNPRHTKTGGARQVTLHAPLLRLLRALAKNAEPAQRITPPNWTRRWKRLRRAAGFARWQPDTLRHTFASYHMKHFKDPTQLQWEMGHRSLEHLRSRYLNLKGLTAADAKQFWAREAGMLAIRGERG